MTSSNPFQPQPFCDSEYTDIMTVSTPEVLACSLVFKYRAFCVLTCTHNEQKELILWQVSFYAITRFSKLTKTSPWL